MVDPVRDKHELEGNVIEYPELGDLEDVELFQQVEEAFGIRVPGEESTACETLGDRACTVTVMNFGTLSENCGGARPEDV